MVVLATNLRAEPRRGVRRGGSGSSSSFPFPDARRRRRIWQHALPGRGAGVADVDLRALAERFEVAGGNIRNIALSAAFLAAADGGVVDRAAHRARRPPRVRQDGQALVFTERIPGKAD